MYSLFFRAFLLISILIIGCTSQQHKATSNTLDAAIKEYFNSNYSSKINRSNDMTLSWITDDSTGTPVLKYAIWNLNTRELIYKGSAIRGKVDWLDAKTIIVDDYPGIIRDDSPLYRYKINVLTKVKTILNENNAF